MQIIPYQQTLSVQPARERQDVSRSSDNGSQPGTVSPLQPLTENFRNGARSENGSGKDEQERQERLQDLMLRLVQQQSELDRLNQAYQQQLEASGGQGAQQRDRANPFKYEIGAKTAEISQLNGAISTVKSSGSIGGFVGNQGASGRAFSFKA